MAALGRNSIDRKRRAAYGPRRAEGVRQMAKQNEADLCRIAKQLIDGTYAAGSPDEAVATARALAEEMMRLRDHLIRLLPLEMAAVAMACTTPLLREFYEPPRDALVAEANIYFTDRKIHDYITGKEIDHERKKYRSPGKLYT